MAYTVLVHIANADPFIAEMEEMPESGANYVVLINIRARDGKPLHYIDPDTVNFLFPWHRITFIELFPSEEDQADVETFFRD